MRGDVFNSISVYCQRRRGRFVTAGQGSPARGNGSDWRCVACSLPAAVGKGEICKSGKIVRPTDRGPLAPLGLRTHPAAVPIVLLPFTPDFERRNVGKYLRNRLGREYAPPWIVAAFCFLVQGGCAYSRDHLLLVHEF